MKMIPVEPSDHFPFQCKCCGACCCHVRESVPLESLDAFRLAKYLRTQGKPVSCVDDVLVQYTEPVLLHESGYTVFMLKTIGTEDSCVFLQDNRCMIHAVKPRACRTYPLSVGPNGHGEYEQYLSMEQTHHFEGSEHSVKKWIRKYCTDEDRAFWELDIGSARELAQLLEQIPQNNMRWAIFLFLMYRYSDFNLDQPFLPQFERNHQKLLNALRELASEEQ